MNNKYLYVLLVVMVLFSGYLYYRLTYGPASHIAKGPLHTPCIPTFADGGGPYYKSNAPFRTKIAPDKNNGEVLIMKGLILQNDCMTPIAGAVLDIWQANETGSYQDAWYRGRVRTNDQGEYSFETIVPKGYGEGTGYRPPHIHFKVFINDRELITSQMFFPQVRGTPGFEEAFIMQLETVQKNGRPSHYGTHDIIVP